MAGSAALDGATRHLIDTGQVGQAVAGDPHGDPAELAELERTGMSAMLIIPAPLGAAGDALVEIYRVRPQAFSRAEIDRARVVALQLRAVLKRLAASAGSIGGGAGGYDAPGSRSQNVTQSR